MLLLSHLPPNQDCPWINNIDCYWAIMYIVENNPPSCVDIDKFKCVSTIDPLQICFKLRKLKIKHVIKKLVDTNHHKIRSGQ
jgi:hypothetical protein